MATKTKPAQKATTPVAVKKAAVSKTVTKTVVSKTATKPVVTAKKALDKKVVATPVSKKVSVPVKTPVAPVLPKALTVKAPARTVEQEKVVTKAIKELNKPVVPKALLSTVKKPVTKKSSRLSTKDMLNNMSDAITKSVS